MSFAPSSRPKKTPRTSRISRTPRTPRTPLRFDPERVEVVIKQKASRVITGPTLTIFVALMVIASVIMAAPNMYEAFNTYVDILEDIGRARNYKKAFKNSQHKESMLIVKKLSEFKVSSIEAVSKLAAVAPAAIGGAGNATTSFITTGVGSVKDVLTVIRIGTQTLAIAASWVGPTILACIMILLILNKFGLPVNKFFESSVSIAMKGGKITLESLAKVYTNLTKVANKRDTNNAMVKSEGKVVNLNEATKTIQNAWRNKKQRMNRASANKLNILANVASNQMKNRKPINKTKLNLLMNAAEKSLNN